MGSHGPAYDRRSPPSYKPFTPECSSRALQDCTQAALDNVYDNSIAYTDRVLALAIDWLGRQAGGFEPKLLYVSDHGESLGEGHLYLHGMPLVLAPREQTQVPLLLWLPPQAAAQASCLRAQRERALSHDHLFHTVLGLVGVRSAEYDAALDIGAGCRAAGPIHG
jgi:lipid A ethanolaminephosphotransferase